MIQVRLVDLLCGAAGAIYVVGNVEGLVRLRLSGLESAIRGNHNGLIEVDFDESSNNDIGSF